MRTTITTILRPLYRSTCVSRHLQLRTRGFCWCKVLLPHTLADGNQHMWIREETMKFLNSLSTLSPYPGLETKWLKSWLQDRSCAHSKIYSCNYTEYWERRLMLFPESQWVVFEFCRNTQRQVMIDFIGCCIGWTFSVDFCILYAECPPYFYFRFVWPTDLKSIPNASTLTSIIPTKFEVDMTIHCQVIAFFSADMAHDLVTLTFDL